MVGVAVVAALGGAVAWARGDIQRHVIARDLDAFYAAAGRGDLVAARRTNLTVASEEAIRSWTATESASHGPPLGVHVVHVNVGGIFQQIGQVTFVVRYADGAEEHSATLWVYGHPQLLPPHTIEWSVRSCFVGAAPDDFGPAVVGTASWTVPFSATDEVGIRRRYSAFLRGGLVIATSEGTDQARLCGTNNP